MTDASSVAEPSVAPPAPASNGNRLKVARWDPSKIPLTSTIFLIGRRGTGKSTLIRDIAYHLAQRTRAEGVGCMAIGMSPTEETAEGGGMSAFIPKSLVFHAYDEKVLQSIMDNQKRMWKRGQGYHIILFLDDCIYDKAILRSKLFRELMMNGRHRRITLLLAAQYCMDLPPDTRSNIDIVITARDNIISSRKKLYENFAGFFESQKVFSQVFSSCTQNFEVLVIDNKTTQSNNASDCVKWYKANTSLPSFRLGSPWTWQLNDRFYCDREAEYDAAERKQASAGPAKSVDRVVKGDEMGRTMINDSVIGGRAQYGWR